MPNVTPAATAPPARAATSTAATNTAGVIPLPAGGRRGDSGPGASITAPSVGGTSEGRRCARASWVPGQDQLARGREPGGSVEADGRFIGAPGPDVPERDPPLLEQPHGTPDQRLTDAATAVLLGDVDLGDLALQPGAGVEEDHP